MHVGMKMTFLRVFCNLHVQFMKEKVFDVDNVILHLYVKF